MGPIVCKFGGSSVENSEAMARCGDILRKYSDVKIAIISATYNTTNELENLARACVNGTEQEAFSLLDQIRKKHTAMAEGLRIDRDAFKRIDQIMVEAKTIAYKVISTKKLDPAIMDRFYCLGERLSSSIFFNYMKKVSPNKNIHFLDARDVIITNSNFSKAEPDFKRIKNKTKRKILSILEDENELIITQGYIGYDRY